MNAWKGHPVISMQANYTYILLHTIFSTISITLYVCRRQLQKWKIYMAFPKLWLRTGFKQLRNASPWSKH